MSALRVLVWTFTLIAFVEIGAAVLAVRVWGHGFWGLSAAAVLVALAFSALRWRDDCLRAETVERFVAAAETTP